MTEQHAYIRDGAEIYRNSFAIIRAEANLSRFGGNEVLISLMSNYVAILIVKYLVAGPMPEALW